MGTVQFNELRSEALALTEADRAKLASDLVASLDGPAEDDAAQAWNVEICRRINEIESGSATLLDADEVINRVKARISS